MAVLCIPTGLEVGGALGPVTQEGKQASGPPIPGNKQVLSRGCTRPSTRGLFSIDVVGTLLHVGEWRPISMQVVDPLFHSWICSWNFLSSHQGLPWEAFSLFPQSPFLLAIFMACSEKFVSWVSSPEEKGEEKQGKGNRVSSHCFGLHFVMLIF